MDCCSPYSEFANRHTMGGLNGSSQEGVSPYYNYSGSLNVGMRYPIQVPPVYRGGAAMPPLPSPALPQPPTNGIDSPVYNEYPNNDRYNNYPSHAPYSFGGNLPPNGGYFNGYNREHNSNYNYYHPYDGYNRYSYHHKDTYSSNFNTYSSPYYQRDHNHHHQPPPSSPSPHHHYHNPYLYNSHGHHAPQTPSYLTDTDGNQTSSSSSNSNTPGSLYSEYPQSPVTPYPPSTPTITSSNGGGTPNATGFPYTNKDGKIRKSSGRDKEKSKVGSRRSSGNNNNNNNSIDSSGMVEPVDRCATPFHGPSQPPAFPNDAYTNFPFGMMNRINQPHQNSYLATQPLPSNFLGNQVPWNTSNRNKKGGGFNTGTDDQMPPPPPTGSAPRTTTPSAGARNDGKNSAPPPSEKSENCKNQTASQPASTAPKLSRPVKRTRKKAKPNLNTNSAKTITTGTNNKIEQTTLKEQKIADINKNITPLPGFQQAFGSTEIGRFSEVFFNLSESPIIDQLFVESEPDTLSPQPWETGDSLEGPHFNLQIGAYYADNYYNSNSNTNSGSSSSNNTNSSDLYSNTSNCINIHNNNYNNYYQYDSGGSSCSTNSNNYSLYNNSNNNLIGNNSNINNCYFREIRCSDY